MFASAVKKHPQLFDIGLQGPDILFFYEPLHKCPINQIGYAMHDASAKEFFYPTRDILNTVFVKDKSAALAYWAYTSSAVTIIMVVLGPILGALSYLKGLKRKIFSACAFVSATSCTLLGFVSHWVWFLLVFVLAKTAYQMSLVVYDSVLGDVTTPNEWTRFLLKVMRGDTSEAVFHLL